MGTDYYRDVIELLPKMIQDKTISPDDLHLIKFTDDVDEAIDHIRTYIDKNYKVRYKASWILGERQ